MHAGKFCRPAHEVDFGFTAHAFHLVGCADPLLLDFMLLSDKPVAILVYCAHDYFKRSPCTCCDTKTVNLRTHDDTACPRVDGHCYCTEVWILECHFANSLYILSAIAAISSEDSWSLGLLKFMSFSLCMGTRCM